ncbi:MAG: helix-turn-helix transcriptional regulator [Clostridia bacterium]|nr:helix-turn-helix transcriptional regulator [Clostridia bacterium]
MMEKLVLRRICAGGVEKEGFSLFCRDTGDEYVFVHFLTPAEVWQDGAWCRVEAGACILAAPHSSRGLRTAGCDLLHDWFHIRGDLSPYLARYGIECGRVFYPDDGGVISRDVGRAELEFVGRAPFSEEACALSIGLLFAHLGGALRSTAPRESPYLYRRFAKLRAEIQRGGQALSVADMAARVGLSPSRFHRLYKGYFGISPAKDLQSARIERAKLLLLGPDMRVAEVAETLGYGSVYHFIRCFRTETGLTPGAYRKRFGVD